MNFTGVGSFDLYLSEGCASSPNQFHHSMAFRNLAPSSTLEFNQFILSNSPDHCFVIQAVVKGNTMDLSGSSSIHTAFHYEAPHQPAPPKNKKIPPEQREPQNIFQWIQYEFSQLRDNVFFK